MNTWREKAAGWLRFEPIRHAPWEVFLLRLGLAWIAWMAFDEDCRFPTQPHPNGIAWWVDLTFLADDAVGEPLRVAARCCLAAWVLGVPAAVSLLLPVFLGIGMFTLKNSQGAIGHSFQVVHVGLLAAWLAGVWGLVCRWRGRERPWGFTAGQLELDWARQALAAGYVVSALTKLIESGGLWFRDSHYFALHLVKNLDMKFYGTLEEGARRLEWLPETMMAHPALSQLFFGLALPLELLAFLGCRNRRLALAFGAGLLLFHWSVKQLTELDFVYNTHMLWVLMVNPLWWLTAAGARLADRADAGKSPG